MFQRIRQYDLLRAGGRWYRPRAYGEPQPDGTWHGWLVFFPLDGSPAVATDRETTQTSFHALTEWAAGLTPIYLDGASARALTLAQHAPVLAELDRAEYEALGDAAQLEAAAEIKRATALVDEAAAAIAYDNADQIRHQRVVAEGALAATEEATANIEASAHEQAAREARATAAKAGQRRRQAAQSARGHSARRRRETKRDGKKR